VSIRNLLGLALAIAAAGALATPAAAQDLARGEALFKLCSQCHGPDGGGNEAIEAPAIAGLPAWYVDSQLRKYRDGIRGSHPDDIAGLRMRPMSRQFKADEDIAALAAYVESMPPVEVAKTIEGGDPERGKTLYAPCTACHGADGKGNPALFAPTLHNTQGWYLASQLRKFKAGWRGANPEDQTGMLMRPMSMTLADDQAVKDVVAYILTLSE
jgi:cytochrome c553